MMWLELQEDSDDIQLAIKPNLDFIFLKENSFKFKILCYKDGIDWQRT